MAKDPKTYEVGYGKPPKRTQFAPGISGNSGRRKRPETSAEIVTRIRDEKIEVNGRLVSKFEIVIQRAFSETIKTGKARDLKSLLEILDKHGALPKADQADDSREKAEKVIEKLRSSFLAHYDIDPEDYEEIRRLSRQEIELIMACPQMQFGAQTRMA